MVAKITDICPDDTYQISRLLMDMPFDPSLVGFTFLSEAIEMVIKSDELQVNLSKNVYSSIAKKYDISISQIDKSIRSLIYNAAKISINNTCINYPTFTIRNALHATKSKSLITAIAEYLKCCKLKYIYEQSLKNKITENN